MLTARGGDIAGGGVGRVQRGAVLRPRARPIGPESGRHPKAVWRQQQTQARSRHTRSIWAFDAVRVNPSGAVIFGRPCSARVKLAEVTICRGAVIFSGLLARYGDRQMTKPTQALSA